MNQKKASPWNTSTISVSGDLDTLIHQGSIVKEGDWYRIMDLNVLGEQLSGLVKHLFVNDQGVLVKLHR